MEETFQHHWGQVYESCNPDEKKHLIIESIDRAAGTAKVSFPGGRGGRDRNRRRRTIKLSSLHSTGTTRTGAQRRSGYRLMAGPPKSGEDMCEMCYHYFNRPDLESGCCQPCTQWLTETFPRPSVRTTHA
ncbi:MULTISPECIES: hypothetical protein [unclassified Streptomyces]|uniref:hypothetical protein n=1 Tax=unclassified Streptomyces TaxID=2593676 RepID=UPI0008058DE1|nr:MULTISPECIES: hypothetical protein [unclassified Streptomyces]MYR75156.1 hypothetical protein [Streptomyces sp. SID4925]SBU98068.1 hypothetical protein YUMDRAFT_06030 [Streptomyces sp. OspMP-M45]